MKRVNIYCSHSNCCGCEVKGRIQLFTSISIIEASVSIRGEQHHDMNCRKSRRVSRLHKRELNNVLLNRTAAQASLHLNKDLSEEERYLGSHTFAPSLSVLRNLKSQGNLTDRYSNDWKHNLEILRRKYASDNQDCIRRITTHEHGVMMYSLGQIKAYRDLSSKDIVYFDATGSIIRHKEGEIDFQIYTLLVRNPYEGGIALPVASYITRCHNGINISHFLETFL